MRFDIPDAMRLTDEIDDVIDGMRGAAAHIDIYKHFLSDLRPEARELIVTGERSIQALRNLIVMLKDPKLSLPLARDLARAINDAESEADNIIARAERGLVSEFSGLVGRHTRIHRTRKALCDARGNDGRRQALWQAHRVAGAQGGVNERRFVCAHPRAYNCLDGRIRQWLDGCAERHRNRRIHWRDVAQSRHPDGGHHEYGRRHVGHGGRGNGRQGHHRPGRAHASLDHLGDAEYRGLGHFRGASWSANQQVACPSRGPRRCRVCRRRTAGAAMGRLGKSRRSAWSCRSFSAASPHSPSDW